MTDSESGHDSSHTAHPLEKDDSDVYGPKTQTILLRASTVAIIGLGITLIIIGAVGGLAQSIGSNEASATSSRAKPHLANLVEIQAPALGPDWSKADDKVSDDHQIVIGFSIRPRNLDIAARRAADVSNPHSSEYGHFFSREQVRDLTAPQAAHVSAVMEWLQKADVKQIRDDAAGNIQVNSTAGTASKLLRTEFHYIVDTTKKLRIVRAGNYWLPIAIKQAVSAIYGLHDLPYPTPNRLPSVSRLESDVPDVTIAVLNRLYNVTGVTPSGSTRNRQAIASVVCKEKFLPSDLAMFFKMYVPDAPLGSQTVYRNVGTDLNVPDGGIGMAEGALDIEYVMGIAPGVLTEFWYFCDPTAAYPAGVCTAFKTWTRQILADPDPPNVFSLSMGFQQPFVMGTFPGAPAYGCSMEQVQDINSDFVKIALRGVTIVAASGDGGSSWVSNSFLCKRDDWLNDTAWEGGIEERSIPAENGPQGCCYGAGKKSWSYVPGPLGPDGTHHNATCIFYTAGAVVFGSPSRGVTSGGPYATSGNFFTTWPASSPWVTAVGSTGFVGQRSASSEVAAFLFGSGGGFSKMFKMQGYQADATQQYLESAPGLPPEKLFPADGRATPDVAALGQHIQIIANGYVQPKMGTSASAPIFAGLISLLNEARLQAGKAPMGFLNPWLYSNADMFTDIVTGNNKLDAIHGHPLRYFFRATKGWDPVTGLGTPRFDRMLHAALEIEDNFHAVPPT